MFDLCGLQELAVKMQPPGVRLEHAHERSRLTRVFGTPSGVPPVGERLSSGTVYTLDSSVMFRSAAEFRAWVLPVPVIDWTGSQVCIVVLFLYSAHPSKGVRFQIQRWRIHCCYFYQYKSKNHQKSLHLASASDAEVPRLHHGEVGESAAHSVMRETVCACVNCMRILG